MKESIKARIKKHIPPILLDTMRGIYYPDHRYVKERKHCLGIKNPDKVFYVFRVDQFNWGIFTIVFDSILVRLECILKKGYIPVFDMQNYRPSMLEDNLSLNLWYRYFAKTEDVFELGDVYQSQNVIISSMNSTIGRENTSNKEGFDKYNTLLRRQIFNKYMAPSEEVLEKVHGIISACFLPEDKILGISVRECYRYVALKYEDGSYLGHPKVLPLDKQIEMVEQYMKEWNCSKLFLMIDDREGLEIFQKHFGDRLIHFEHPLVHYFRNGQIQLGDELTVELDGNNGNRLINYMVEVELLARCDCIISSLSSGAEAAILRNDGKYEHCELIDLGVYKADDVKK